MSIRTNTILLFPVICLIIFSPTTLFAEEKPLKRRGLAGFGYRGITDEDIKSKNFSDKKGVIVTRVLKDMPAEKAGLIENDLIIAYDNVVITDQHHFLELTRRYYSGDKVVITFLREGTKNSVTMEMTVTNETSSDVEIEYTSFESEGVRLRALITSPLGEKDKKLPAILIVTALGSGRLINIPSYVRSRDLAYQLTREGFRVMRFELRGYGDSEGKNYKLTDFHTEIKDNLSGYDYLVNREDVDPKKVYVYGHSTGGIVAASLAVQRDLAGVILSCTVGRTYYERLIETVRLQDELAGESPAEIHKNIEQYILFTILLKHGSTLEEIILKYPELKIFINSNGRIMDDRSEQYWRQQLEINLADLYSKISEPVLILYAGSDFLTQLACHKWIRKIVESSGNSDVVLEVVEKVDHAYALAEDKKASFENYKTRNFVGSDEPGRRIIKWLTEVNQKQ